MPDSSSALTWWRGRWPRPNRRSTVDHMSRGFVDSQTRTTCTSEWFRSWRYLSVAETAMPVGLARQGKEARRHLLAGRPKSLWGPPALGVEPWGWMSWTTNNDTTHESVKYRREFHERIAAASTSSCQEDSIRYDTIAEFNVNNVD